MCRLTLLIVALAAGACSSAPLATETNQLEPIRPKLSACKQVFSARISQSFAGVAFPGSKNNKLDVIFTHLPAKERRIFSSASLALGSSLTQNKTLSLNEKAALLTVLSNGFRKAEICNEPKLDMYTFADELRAYLLARDVDTSAIFSLDRRAVSSDYSLHRVLLVLVLHAGQQ